MCWTLVLWYGIWPGRKKKHQGGIAVIEVVKLHSSGKQGNQGTHSNQKRNNRAKKVTGKRGRRFPKKRRNIGFIRALPGLDETLFIGKKGGFSGSI